MKHSVRACIWLIAAAVLFCFLTQACSSGDHLVPSPFERSGIVFVTQNVTPALIMTALFDGQVVRDDTGCVRLVSSEGAFVIWPKDFTVAEVGGEFVIRDASGRDAGRIGGRFRLSGGSVATLHDGLPISAPDRSRALQACPGAYWLVGSVVK